MSQLNLFTHWWADIILFPIAIMYRFHQSEWYPKRCQIVRKTAGNVTNLTCYFGQVNSLRLKSCVVSKWASNHFWGTIYFASDGTEFTNSMKFLNEKVESLPFSTFLPITGMSFQVTGQVFPDTTLQLKCLGSFKKFFPNRNPLFEIISLWGWTLLVEVKSFIRQFHWKVK